MESDVHARDVVVVGGGPAGCAVGVFTARYGLDTSIFDRGTSSLRRSAFLENYLGFPAGIDIETFYELSHDHAQEAGCDVISDAVEAVVERDDDEDGFRVETQDGRTVRAERVVAATKYDWEYVRDIHPEFVVGDEYEEFNADLVGGEGRTPVDGLYVAGPNAGVADQALVAAGHGAQVGRAVIADVRRDEGYEGEFAEHYDWLRREEELTGEWATRERWEEYLDEHSDGPEDEELRERYIDARFAKYVSDEERNRRKQRAHERLAEHLDSPDDSAD